MPGYDWALAWVSWRTGGDYVGWAPLTPAVVYEGTAIAGNIDLQFDIGPQYYNFVDVRYIGEPVLSGRIFAPQQNITIINQTVNVTNITNNNNIIINNGPDFRRLNQYSQRPIQRLTLNRTTTLPGGGASRNLNHVNGGELTVVAPAIQKPAGKIAPAQVKRTVAQPKIENGWQGVSNRAQLEAAMKKENPRAIPPPTVKLEENRPNESIANAPVRPENNETANIPPPPRDHVQNPNLARQQTPSGAMRPMVPAQNETEPETPTSETQAAEAARNQELQRQQLQQRPQQPGPNAQQRKPKKNPNQEQTPSPQQP